METEILYIGNPPGNQWLVEIKAGLNQEVCIQVLSEDEAKHALLLNHFPIILIDSGSVDNVPSLIRALLEIFDEAKIIILSNTPTWHRALQAYQAGALDYFSKLLDKDKLFATLNRIIPLMTAVFPVAFLAR
jgi:DNA-binding NtrC family response regulator